MFDHSLSPWTVNVFSLGNIVDQKSNAMSSVAYDLFLFSFLLFCTCQVSGINSEREGEAVHVGLLMVGR